MGFLDDAKKKLGDAVDKHGDKISDGLDRAGDAVDEKTGGKHGDKIRTGVAKTKDVLDGLDGKRDDMPRSRTPSTAPESPKSPDEPATDPVPTDHSPEPPKPGANPNDDIESGTRVPPSGGPR